MTDSLITAEILHDEVLSKRFNIDNYAPVARFDLAAWADQLTFRYHFFNMDNTEWDLVSLMLQMLDKPLGNSPDSSGGRTFGIPSVMISSVNDLTVGDYFYAGFDLQAKNKAFDDAIKACEKQNRNFDVPRDEEETLTTEENSLIHTSFDDLHVKLIGKPYFEQRIGVDLDCSDETIIRDFETWLAAKRKKLAKFHLQQKRRIGRKEFDAWVQVQFLAYLDIRMFCNWFGIAYKELSRKQYADLLFPIEKQDANDTTDRLETVRKTLHDNYFEKYFNNKFLTLLQQEVRIQYSRRPHPVE